MPVTISRALSLDKELRARHNELVNLRNDNSRGGFRMVGEKEVSISPVYDVKALDQLVTRIAKEIRILSDKIKETNAKTVIEGYEEKEDILGEIK